MSEYIVIKDDYDNVYGRVEKSNLRNVYTGIDGNLHFEYYGGNKTIVGLHDMLFEYERAKILKKVLSDLGEDVPVNGEPSSQEKITEEHKFQPKVLLEEFKEELKDKVQKAKVDFVGLQFLANVAAAVVTHKASKFIEQFQDVTIEGSFKELNDTLLDSMNRAKQADIYRAIFNHPVKGTNEDFRYNAIKLYCEKHPDEMVPHIKESTGTWVWDVVQQGESTEYILSLIHSYIDEYHYSNFSLGNLIKAGLFDIDSQRN